LPAPSPCRWTREASCLRRWTSELKAPSNQRAFAGILTDRFAIAWPQQTEFRSRDASLAPLECYKRQSIAKDARTQAKPESRRNPFPISCFSTLHSAMRGKVRRSHRFLRLNRFACNRLGQGFARAVAGGTRGAVAVGVGVG